MQDLFARVKRRLAQRPDSEHGQAIVRVVLISLILTYVLLSGARLHRLDQYQGVLATVVTGLGLSLLLFGWLLWRPQRSDPRRVAGMLADYGLIAIGMIQMGEPLAWVYAVVMWVTVGNGLRFGPRYLAAAVVLAMASFGTTVLLTPYWQANLGLAVSLWLGLLAVPLCCSSLLRRRMRHPTMDTTPATGSDKRSLLARFKQRLSGREDSEHAQNLIRIIITALFISYLGWRSLSGGIEAGKVRVESHEFALADVLQAINLILTPQTRSKSLDYRVQVDDNVPPRLLGDAGHLQQILLNLMGNAVKFTDSGYVHLRVSSPDAPGSQRMRLRFEIVDTGIGVPVALRGRLFNAFEQGDVGLARRHEGTGLGTAIAKGLVESMGGQVGYAPNSPRGSVFWVEITLDVAETASAPAVPSEVAEAGNVIAFSNPFLRHRARVRSLRVLVADDHEANRMVLQRLLEKAGHKVTCVNGGAEVLDALEQASYDAAIVDLHMPGMSGLDLLKQLRVMQASGMPYVPVMVLSADVTPESILRCEQAGARAFLAKPVVATRLLEVLADVAANTRAEPGIQSVPALPVGDGVLDTAVLDELASLGMGDGFERKFIDQCLADVDASMGQLQGCGERQAWEDFREHAHALRGVASNLGLVQVAASSGEIMRMADWQLKGEWSARLSNLATALRNGRNALDARSAGAPHRDDSERSPS